TWQRDIQEVLVSELSLNPALNRPQVQEELVRALRGPARSSALAVLIATAKADPGATTNPDPPDAQSAPAYAVRPLLGPARGPPSPGPATADAGRGPLNCAPDVAREILENARRHAGEPEVQTSLARIAVDYGRDRHTTAVADVRYLAAGLLKPQRQAV